MCRAGGAAAPCSVPLMGTVCRSRLGLQPFRPHAPGSAAPAQSPTSSSRTTPRRSGCLPGRPRRRAAGAAGAVGFGGEVVSAPTADRAPQVGGCHPPGRGSPKRTSLVGGAAGAAAEFVCADQLAAHVLYPCELAADVMSPPPVPRRSVPASRPPPEQPLDDVTNSPDSPAQPPPAQQPPAQQRQQKPKTTKRPHPDSASADRLEDDDSDETEDVKATETSDGYTARTQSRQGDKARLPRADLRPLIFHSGN